MVVGDSGQMSYPGQVIGCNYSNVKSIADEVDAFLFVGGGLFHALGIALSTSKPTVIADPYDNRAFQLMMKPKKSSSNAGHASKKPERKNLRRPHRVKTRAKTLDQALKIKELAEKHGKAAYLLAAREITPETFLEFPSIDAYVNTACPRISLEASEKFSKPVLTVNEFMVVVGESSWENMLKKGLFES